MVDRVLVSLTWEEHFLDVIQSSPILLEVGGMP